MTRSFRLQEVDSTNAEAARLLAEQSPPFYVTAAVQTNGRGRGSNGWHSALGNLHFSLALSSPPSLPTVWAAFAASLATAELAEEEGARQCFCKWPNDIIIGADEPRKLGGILAVKEDKALIIGIGLNLGVAPLPGACCLADCGSAVEPSAAAERLAIKLRQYQTLAIDRGMEPLLERWRRRAFRLGREIALQSGGKTLQGIFVDVRGDGALLLEGENGVEAIYAADASWKKL